MHSAVASARVGGIVHYSLFIVEHDVQSQLFFLGGRFLLVKSFLSYLPWRFFGHTTASL